MPCVEVISMACLHRSALTGLQRNAKASSSSHCCHCGLLYLEWNEKGMLCKQTHVSSALSLTISVVRVVWGSAV